MQGIFQRLKGLFAEKAAAEKADLRQVVELLATGREAELPEDSEVMEICEAAGIDAADLAEIVERERKRLADIKAVAAGRVAADRQRELSAMLDKRLERFYADTIALKAAYGADLDKINAELSPLNQIINGADVAQRALLEAAQDARFEGASRAERIATIQNELATAAAFNERVKELEKNERHARAAVDIAKSKLRAVAERGDPGSLYGMPQSEADEITEAFRVATVVHERAVADLAAARQRSDENDRRRRADEAETLGLVTAG